jgi:fucose permease
MRQWCQRSLGGDAPEHFLQIFFSQGRIAMLLPRFSIRTLLVLLTIGAAASVVIGTAFRGQNWAWGASIGLLSLFITFVFHAAWFAAISGLTQRRAARPTQSDVTE